MHHIMALVYINKIKEGTFIGGISKEVLSLLRKEITLKRRLLRQSILHEVNREYQIFLTTKRKKDKNDCCN